MKTLNLPEQSPLLSSDFIYGVATSSFQIEGHTGKVQPCIWDTFCKKEGVIKDASDGSAACQHIEHWQDDVALIESLGVDAYRFSIAWARVLHTDGSVNQAGIDFYVALLDKLNSLNIKPFVTLYHWDLPQVLEDAGGWLNRDTAYRFQEYVAILVKAFGDRVYSYATLNEPFCSAHLGYELGIHAPGLTGQKNGRAAAHHLLLAHGLGMQVLNSDSPKTVNGIVLNITPTYPATNTEQDIKAAQMADDYLNQWYFRPVLEGKYPDLLESLPTNNKPPVEQDDMAIINQPIDFLGINYYTRARFAHDAEKGYKELPVSDAVEKTAMGWEVYPKGFSDVLRDLHQRYTLPPMYICENGAATDDKVENGEVNDTQRVRYFQSHLNEVDACVRDGVDIRGYFAWSLMDNFEWAEGYAKRFGIVYVDYASQQRIKKDSAKAFAALIKSRT